MRIRLLLLLVGIAVSAVVFSYAHAQNQPPQAAHRFTQIAPGVYSALGTGTLNVGSNSCVIVNQEDVLIVDSHISPEAGRVLLRELKTITDKPVRFLVNTHFHFDHANGNQVFTAPVDIIGHEFTRRKLLGDVLAKGTIFAESVAAIPNQIAQLEQRAAAEQEPAAKARLDQQVRVQTAYAEQVKEVKPTPPSVTLNDHMTLFRGDREIRLLHLGHAHTAGDVVVFLPRERVVCTGDMLVAGISNLSDGFVNEWPDTVEKLRALDFTDVIPGHGEPWKGKEKIDHWQAYLRDIWQQTKKLHDEKVPAADAAKRIDMTKHKDHYPTITGPGVAPIGVVRMYDVMDGRADK
jgi:glyoxylase-like metal-dependent hydrolase (beta-lactamase superfamily II)